MSYLDCMLLPLLRRLAVWLTLAALCCATLPTPPAWAAIISKAEERKIGKKVLAQVRRSTVVRTAQSPAMPRIDSAIRCSLQPGLRGCRASLGPDVLIGAPPPRP